MPSSTYWAASAASTMPETRVMTFTPVMPNHYELSPPFHYQPGDATVHGGYMIHGAPPNTTDRDRWAYIYGYIPAETRYITGKSVRPCIERRPPDDADCPIVYPAG